ncbi:MAG: hypothetical protein HOA15_03465 [Candidatus Marinimicrobia bacterium]|nr:hypothetical protein [Candidatus Neomarinimicrobiota bacterium]MBT3675566.1 hypothetical protein [Candidatus Neomarinimicrobiota bacterium]MBT3763357.1 hypothetical protein [Candidatus Neomarinimicrobiota bacterium]MBT4069075.1 hypothetical protein [Candidatus Neomarinimicrobiota bacterium]MBT4270227.1 hypothetical protein [Candidatus Neomarinimicrobiota bacterium]
MISAYRGFRVIQKALEKDPCLTDATRVEGCVSCHQVYAKDRFDGFSTYEEAAHEH